MLGLRLLLVLLALAAAATSPFAQAPAGHAVVLITLDGARTEEIFGGLDAAVLSSTLREGAALDEQAVYNRFWAPTPEERRAKLMPFFWGTLLREHGSIAGNPKLGSRVHLTNEHWFSYPGYSEILVGRAHDDVIKSNDPLRNPNRTVLEFLKDKASLSREQVAVFASWSVFNEISEHREGTLTINAGFEVYPPHDSLIQQLSLLQFETPTPWQRVRHDAYTMAFAMDHLTRYHPRVIYLALGETDDWAHDGRYDRVLETYARTDRWLKELWSWLQSEPEYRGRTSMLLTTDHGRGHHGTDWRDHGRKVVGSNETWMAFVSPSLARRGEWRDHPPITASQVAATLIDWAGFDWKLFDPNAAPPVREQGFR